MFKANNEPAPRYLLYYITWKKGSSVNSSGKTSENASLNEHLSRVVTGRSWEREAGGIIWTQLISQSSCAASLWTAIKMSAAIIAA